MFEFDPHKVLLNARQATTEDLLDRVTAFRAGMEPEAVAIIEEELQRRGVSRQEIAALAEQSQREHLREDDGTAHKCSFCQRPAVAEQWGWHRLFGRVPVFPRRLRYCPEHQLTKRM